MKSRRKQFHLIISLALNDMITAQCQFSSRRDNTSYELNALATVCLILLCGKNFSQMKQIKLDKELGWPALIHQNNYLIDIRTNFISQCVLFFAFKLSTINFKTSLRERATN